MTKNLKYLVVLTLLLISNNIMSQNTQQSGNWGDNSTWVDNSPGYNFNNNTTININTNHDVISNNNILFNNNATINVYGRLTINGDLNVHNGLSINIFENGVFIVNGTIDMNNNANITVDGDLYATTITGGNNNNISGEGNVYVENIEGVNIGGNINVQECDFNSIYFPGNQSSYIYFPELWSSTEFSTSELTISTWVKWETNSPTPQWANMITYNSPTGSGDNGSFWLQHNQDNTRFEFAVQTNNGRVFVWSDESLTIQNDIWYHLTGVYDGSELKLYVNGILQNDIRSLTGVVNYNSNFELNIGRWANSSGENRYFNGHLLNITLWSIALTNEEVLDLIMSPDSFIDNNINSLLGKWDLNNIQGTLVPDDSNYGINGVISGFVTGSCTELPDVNTIMPILLLSFTAYQHQRSIKIEWVTASEINNDYFVLELSTDLQNWNIVTYVQGAGDSNSLLKYSYVDENPYHGISYYRLTQHDFDGKFEVFSPAAVNFSISDNFRVEIYDFMGVKLKEMWIYNIDERLPSFNRPVIVRYFNNQELIQTRKLK